MHIVHMIDTLHIGGAQKLLVLFAAAAQIRHVRLTVISLRDSHTPIANELRTCGAHVVAFPSSTAHSLLDLQRLRRLAGFFGRTNVDVLHTHLTYANITGAIVGQWVGIPVVATLHSTETDKQRYDSMRQRLEVWALRYGIPRVLAVGYAVADAYRAWMRRNSIEVIPNAVAAAPTLSPTERGILRAMIVGDQTRPVLISAGRLELEKGYFDLLHAFATLHNTHPAAALVIVGNGRLHADLAAQIAALNLEGHAILLGERHDVPRLLAASDIYVSSSHWEGLPVAVLEAMAAGLPIVATSVGDLPHVVVDSTGVLVPPREPSRLAVALQALLDNPTQRQALGAAAQAYVAHNYSPEVWFNRLMTLYKEVCGSPNRRRRTTSRLHISLP